MSRKITAVILAAVATLTFSLVAAESNASATPETVAGPLCCR